MSIETLVPAGPSEREALARSALEGFTRPGDVGPLVGEELEDGVFTLRFFATTPGYPGWLWTVSIAQLEDAEPTVLESELLPGDGALLAPEWVPWSTRLEEWRAQQAASGAEPDAASDDDPDSEDEEDEPEEDDLGDDVYDGLDPEAALGFDDDPH